MATRFRAIEPVPPPKPKHDRVVLMADQFGQVHYKTTAVAWISDHTSL
jgi:hypothetical protein